MPRLGFEPAIPGSQRPQTHALDRASTTIGNKIGLRSDEIVCQGRDDTRQHDTLKPQYINDTSDDAKDIETRVRCNKHVKWQTQMVYTQEKYTCVGCLTTVSDTPLSTLITFNINQSK